MIKKLVEAFSDKILDNFAFVFTNWANDEDSIEER